MFATCLQIQIFLKRLVGGFILVLSIHSLIGSVRLSWPSTFVSYSSDAVTWLKVFANMLLLVGQGIIIATGTTLVEEFKNCYSGHGCQMSLQQISVIIVQLLF